MKKTIRSAPLHTALARSLSPCLARSQSHWQRTVCHSQSDRLEHQKKSCCISGPVDSIAGLSSLCLSLTLHRAYSLTNNMEAALSDTTHWWLLFVELCLLFSYLCIAKFCPIEIFALEHLICCWFNNNLPVWETQCVEHNDVQFKLYYYRQVLSRIEEEKHLQQTGWEES